LGTKKQIASWVLAALLEMNLNLPEPMIFADCYSKRAQNLLFKQLV
jgi:hypothetical protein